MHCPALFVSRAKQVRKDYCNLMDAGQVPERPVPSQNDSPPSSPPVMTEIWESSVKYAF